MFFWRVPAPNEALLISGVIVGRVFAGHLRSIVGGLTVEQIIRERDRVAQEVKDGSHAEMEKLGIVVDALEIQEIEDGTGYINNLAAPHAAAVASQARIAQAQADQEAAQRELEVAAMKAQYERDTEIRKAGFLAETEEARARVSQAGPLAEADRDQAELNAQAEAFRKRALAEADRDQAKFAADAEAYANTTLADAEAQAARVKADAAAHAQRSTADGKADANRALAESLREGNQELIAASRIIEELPELVNAASRGIAGSNLTVLNGAAGVSEVLAGLISQGMAVLDLLRSSTAAGVNGAQTPSQPAGKAVTS